MKIIIDISEEMHNSIANGSFGAKYNIYDLCGLIMNGIPLPKVTNAEEAEQYPILSQKDLNLKIYCDDADEHVYLKVNNNLYDLTKMIGRRIALRIFYEVGEDKEKLIKFYKSIAPQLKSNKED